MGPQLSLCALVVYFSSPMPCQSPSYYGPLATAPQSFLIQWRQTTATSAPVTSKSYHNLGRPLPKWDIPSTAIHLKRAHPGGLGDTPMGPRQSFLQLHAGMTASCKKLPQINLVKLHSNGFVVIDRVLGRPQVLSTLLA